MLISPAAGLNKNGEIPPEVLKSLGFGRNVVGSITGKSCAGNPRPRIKNIQSSKSILNWMGLPNHGAYAISQRLIKQNNCLPLTISIAPHPQQTDKLTDLQLALELTAGLGDRLEFNVSCPNSDQQVIAQLKDLDNYLKLISEFIGSRKLFIKIPPLKTWLLELCKVASTYNCVSGFTATNSSLQHSYPRGAISGGELFSLAQEVIFELQQIIQHSYQDKKWEIIACGGIDNQTKMLHYQQSGIREIQIYTPFIYQGPRLLSKLNNARPVIY